MKRQRAAKDPFGFKLLHTLRGHRKVITRLSWSPDGLLLASAAQDGRIRIWDLEAGDLRKVLEMPGLRRLGSHWVTQDSASAIAWRPAWTLDGRRIACGYGDTKIRIWDVKTGETLHELGGHTAKVNNVAWSPDGSVLASSADDATIMLWDAKSLARIGTLEEHSGGVNNIAWHPSGKLLASASLDGTIRLWNIPEQRLLRIFWGHRDMVITVIWSPDGSLLASSSGDATIRIWDISSESQVNLLEGHSAAVSCIAYSTDGRLLASKGIAPDSTVRLWRTDTWGTVAQLPEGSASMWFAGVAFHPHKMILATLDEHDTAVRIWNLDDCILPRPALAQRSVTYTTAKIALVGDSGVGKTGLGWRLAHRRFKEQPSTHGQQFWVIDDLGSLRTDGTVREAILWDLAGQPDYRLVHSLFLDDISLALLLFDPTNREKPLAGVGYWLQQLSRNSRAMPPAILVGARVDRGAPTLTDQELESYCERHGVTGGHIATSARDGMGIRELLSRIRSQIDWSEIPVTVTTITFKRIKDFILRLKASQRRRSVLVRPETFRRNLKREYTGWAFTRSELNASIKYLQNHGYLTTLPGVSGEELVLLQPDTLINLASSIVLEARRSPKGLGALEEATLLKGGYPLEELSAISGANQQALLNAATKLFIERNVCFRESLGGQVFLVFPALINEKPPKHQEIETVDDIAFGVAGAVENVYSSLVVLLGYTNTFNRSHHWQNRAQYELEDGEICGFRQESEHESEIELVLYYGKDAPEFVRALFRGLFEKFLGRFDVSVVRYPPVSCPACRDLQDRSVVQRQVERGRDLHCPNCGEIVPVESSMAQKGLERHGEVKLSQEQAVARRRTALETAMVYVKSHLIRRGDEASPPSCFVSYAWGDSNHQEWVANLAKDLRQAGVDVVLDRWHSVPGASITKFIERIREIDFVVAVGSRLYLSKYNADDADPVVDAELRLIGTRLRKRAGSRESVIPLLLEGEVETAFPPQFEDSVWIDFRSRELYFAKLFDLILTLYRIPFDRLDVENLRESMVS